MTKSLSSIIKSTFINLTTTSKKIITDKTDNKIINYPQKEEVIDEVAVTTEESSKSVEIEAREIAENILNQASFDANNIIENAKSNAINIEQEAFQKGKNEGYDAGYSQGMREVELLNQQALKNLEEAQEQKIDILRSIEPKMVNIIISIIQKISGVIKKEDIILHMIRQGLSELEVLDYIIIHVSPEDYNYVLENLNKINENLSEKIDLEILRDTKLHKNDCVIETEVGNIDCSLETQLEGLLTDLNLISNGLNQHKG